MRPLMVGTVPEEYTAMMRRWIRDTIRKEFSALALLPLFGAVLGTAESLLAQDVGDSGSARAVSLMALSLDAGLDIQLDGRIDEAAWRQAVPITDFTQQEPTEGGPPSEATEVRVVFDDDALYIGAILFDDPEGIIALQKRRDGALSTDDRFQWILDTFHDGRTGYFFEVNAAGMMGDALLTATASGGGGGGSSSSRFRRAGGSSGGGSSRAWDGIWEVRTHIRPDGWSLEIRIPFRTLNFDPETDTWGINFQRTIRRKNEEILWRGYRRNQGLRRPVHAGELTGLRGVSQGAGIEVVPYAVTNWKNDPANMTNPTTYPSDIGMDVNYNLTPSIRVGVSVNTDFAEAEVDQRRINLTRFPLRFPERRDFFLEGSSVFSFAPGNGIDPYFSRKIGLLSGEQIPLDFAARLGGQAGSYELGFIHVSTADVASEGAASGLFPGEQFTVARVKRAIFEQSTIGAIYTRRATDADRADPTALVPEDRHTAGMDLHFFTSRLFGDRNFQVRSFVTWNSNPHSGIERTKTDLSAHGFRLSYPNEVWTGSVTYRQLGDDYNPAIGFVTRNAYRRVEPRIGWKPRPDIDWLRRINFSAMFRHLEGLETGITEEQLWQFKLLGLNFESQDNFDVDLNRQYEYLDAVWEISEGVMLPVGAYSNWEWAVSARTAGQRVVSGNVRYTKGGFWSGDRTQVGLGMDIRPSAGVILSASVENNDVVLPEGSFTARLIQVSSGWDVTPLVSLTGNVQYDDASEIVGLFMRTRWILQPGNELFIVFTQNWQNLGTGLFDRDAEFLTLSRGGSVKLNYTYRL